jgi:hypothetical protein
VAASGGGGSAAVRTFTVTNSGSGAYLIDGASNPTLTLERGQTYDFAINASGHPFHFQTVPPPYSSGNLYTTGVTGSGTASGTIRIVVPYDAPSTLYYVCQFHGSMGGAVNIVNANEDSVLRSFFLPAAPTGVTAVNGNAQATVSWTAPTVLAQTPITDYTVQFKPSGGAFQPFTRAASTATTATVTGLTNGTAYVFRVAAVNGIGTGPYTAESSSVTPIAETPPNAPTSLAATAGNAQIALAWTAPSAPGTSAITGYTVEYTPSGGSAQTVSTGSSSTSYTLTGLTNGTAYTVRVAAVSSAGTGTYTAASSAVTPAAAAAVTYANKFGPGSHSVSGTGTITASVSGGGADGSTRLWLLIGVTGTLSYTVTASSEGSFDFGSLFITNSSPNAVGTGEAVSGSLSGTQTVSGTRSVTAGQHLVLQYTKDDSGDALNDRVTATLSIA